LLLHIAFQNTKAQTWCPAGAIWHYKHYTWDPWLGGNLTYLKYQYVSDTTIGGINCKRVDKYFQTTFSQSIYTYADSDRVYMLRDTIFYPVYNFNASVGDTMIIPGGIDVTYNGICTNPFGAIRIDSAGTVNVNGELLRYICVSPTPTSQWGISGRIVEKIGPTYGHLASFEPTLVDFYLCGVVCPSPAVISLRCYSDDNFSQYSIGTLPCDYVSSITEYLTSNLLNLFPNPANNFINVNYTGKEAPQSYTIRDIFGNVIVSKNISSNNFTISTEALQQGIYFLSIVTSQKNECTKRVSIIKQ